MALPLPWVKRIFERLAVVYGTAFTRQWEGIEIEAVMADWAEELSGFEHAPDSISFGLSVIDPDRPPNVLQFKALCHRAPSKAPIALPRPAPTDADRERVRAMLAAVRERITNGAKP